jgi:hypothetical protein
MRNVSFSLNRPRTRFTTVAPDNSAFGYGAAVLVSSISANPIFARRVAAPEPSKPTKEMTWGEPTWHFLHTMSEKVFDARFADIRVELLNILYMVCTNLPCPTCADHAKGYMAGLNFNAINDKQTLKEFFWNFHNMLNSQKGLPFVGFSEVEDKYSRAYTRLIIHNFILSFDNAFDGQRFLPPPHFGNCPRMATEQYSQFCGLTLATLKAIRQISPF